MTSGPRVDSTGDRIASAVFNNAVWCDAVCRALGCDTAFVAGLWINRSPSPPFYPNAATLTRDGSDSQIQHIRLMTDGGLPAGWSVKDGFSTLDLAALGFDLLFEAAWLGLPAGRATSGTDLHGMGLEQVTSEPELAAWEAAWRSVPGGTARRTFDPPRIFMPALLGDPNIVFLAAYRRGRIAGVVVGSRSDDGLGPVAGVSNLVLPAKDGEDFRAGAIAAVRSAFPDLPLVSYDGGSDLEAMIALGFEPLGPLRVWVAA
jgi:hypothetical protein